MNKKILYAAALALTVCAGWSFSKSFTKDNNLSDLQIENVEALAEEETNVIPCVTASGSNCSYTARLVDGRTVKVTLKDAKSVWII